MYYQYILSQSKQTSQQYYNKLLTHTHIRNDVSDDCDFAFLFSVCKEHYRSDRAAQREVNDLPTKCYLNDCSWKGRFGVLEHHLTKCSAGEGVLWLCPECRSKICLLKMVRHCITRLRTGWILNFFFLLVSQEGHMSECRVGINKNTFVWMSADVTLLIYRGSGLESVLVVYRPC